MVKFIIRDADGWVTAANDIQRTFFQSIYEPKVEEAVAFKWTLQLPIDSCIYGEIFIKPIATWWVPKSAIFQWGCWRLHIVWCNIHITKLIAASTGVALISTNIRLFDNENTGSQLPIWSMAYGVPHLGSDGTSVSALINGVRAIHWNVYI